MATIVIADDDRSIQHVLTVLCHMAGHTVQVADDGQHLLALVQQVTPDLILSDLEMPGLRGDDAIRQLRQTCQCATTPILLMSGRPDVQQIAAACGATSGIAKPFPLTAIEDFIARATREAAEHTALP